MYENLDQLWKASAMDKEKIEDLKTQVEQLKLREKAVINDIHKLEDHITDLVKWAKDIQSSAFLSSEYKKSKKPKKPSIDSLKTDFFI